jgi:hypothetical protein
MSRRNLRHNAASFDFVGNFSPRPLADRTFFRLLTGQRDHLAGLFRHDLRRTSWTGHIGQTLAHGHTFQRDRLPADPAHAPGAHRIHADSQVSGNLAIMLALSSRQDDSSSQRQLLGVLCRCTSTSNSFRSASFKVSASGFGPRIAGSLFLAVLRSQYTTDLFQPQCTSVNCIPLDQCGPRASQPRFARASR